MNHIERYIAPAAPTISYTYISRPDLHPSPWNVTFVAENAKLADAYVFIAPDVVEPTGLTIYDNTGELVYLQDDDATEGASNFRVQSFEGKDYLTYWAGAGTAVRGHGVGNDIILNDDYSVAFNFSAPGVDLSDLHEFEIAKTDNKAAVTQYKNVTGLDTTSIPGGLTNSFVLDGCFYDIDIRTGKSEFKFCALEDGISIQESLYPLLIPPNSTANAWDFIHVNSVVKDALGNYLLSGRHTSSAFYIDGHTGQILWRLGGKNSTFTGTGTSFKWQHHIRFVGESNATADDIRKATKRRLSVFDNHGNFFIDQNEQQSRGLLLEIDLTKNTTTIIQEYSAPGGEDNLLTLAEGSTQFLQDEPTLQGECKSTNVFVGYGTVPVFAEYTEDGAAQRVVHFGTNSSAQNYRAFKQRWVGKPKNPPDAVIQNGAVYVSWNGATEVKKWRLLQGDGAHKLTNATSVPKTRFETTIPFAPSSQFVQVAGLDAKGKVLGRSAVLKTS